VKQIYTGLTIQCYSSIVYYTVIIVMTLPNILW